MSQDRRHSATAWRDFLFLAAKEETNSVLPLIWPVHRQPFFLLIKPTGSRMIVMGGEGGGFDIR